MKVVYMGTPEFAVAPLNALVEAGCEIGYVLTQPDRARDRGKKVQPTPIKTRAEELNLKVLQPEKLKNNAEIFRLIEEYAPDLIVVAAYGKILPPELIHMPRFGCVNVHASLLPKYRGAAPVQRAILEGEEYSGVTLMKMEEGLDTGAMIACEKVFIGSMTAGELFETLSLLGAKLLKEILPDIENAISLAITQDDEKATYAPMVSKTDAMLDFAVSSEKADCVIRAFNPNPGAYTLYRGENVKVWEALPTENVHSEQPGTVLSADNDGIEIACGSGTLLIKVLQLAGKKRMPAGDFLRGKKIEKGEIFGK